jgi:cysteine-rich repeat protein
VQYRILLIGLLGCAGCPQGGSDDGGPGTESETGDGGTGDGDGDGGTGDGDGDGEPVCGNGIIEGDEACDDGNLVNNDGCTNLCMLPACGDWLVQPGESCDDGNNVDGDGCESDCTLTPDLQPPEILSFTANGNVGDFAVGGVEWVALEAVVIDDIAVDRVEFRAGDLLVGVDGTAPYQAQWLVNSATQSGTPLTVTAFDTSNKLDQAGPIVVITNLPPCGTQLWSTPVEVVSRVETRTGGDVLLTGTLPPYPGPVDEYDSCSEHVEAYFAGLDGTDGSLNWSDSAHGDCYNDGTGIAGVGDRIFGLFVHHNDYGSYVSRFWTYDADGVPLGSSPVFYPLYSRAGDITVGANGRGYYGGRRTTANLAVLAELDPEEGDDLWLVSSDWGIGLEWIRALDVFVDGQFVIVDQDGALARITQDEQVVWSLPPGSDVPPTIDVGGPLETIAVHREVDLVEVREPDGSERWQTPGQVVQVDPNGDVVLMSADGLAVEKRSGADGSLVCTFPAAGFEIALDEWGFIVVASSNPSMVSKYTP